MAELMELNGLDVLHEKMGEHGISSWMFAVGGAQKVPWTYDDSAPVDYSFKTLVHVIREPLAAISSVYFTESVSEAWRSEHCLICGNKMERAVASYIGWNKMIQSRGPDYTVALEDKPGLRKVTLELTHKYSYREDADIDIILPDGPVNTREHAVLTEAEIADMISPCLADELSGFIDWYTDLFHLDAAD